MIAPPPAAGAYRVMLRSPATESVGVLPCEYVTIAGIVGSEGMLAQSAHGRFGLQMGLNALIVVVASCGLMESISKRRAPSTESGTVMITRSVTALVGRVSESRKAGLPFNRP